ncbi:MAG: hypothetical protein WDW36_006599 [Sanguina aurantia]
MVGVPTPVLFNLPWLQYINARNLRAIFHRYCLAHNKGPLPPHTPWLQPSAPRPTTLPGSAPSTGAVPGPAGGLMPGAAMSATPAAGRALASTRRQQGVSQTVSAGAVVAWTDAAGTRMRDGTDWGAGGSSRSSGSGGGGSYSARTSSRGGGSGGAGIDGGGGDSGGRGSGSGYHGLPPIHQSEEVDPWAFKHEQCCCMYRSLSVMEMQTFWALTMDIEVISDALRRPDCSFDQARLQSAFVTSASIAGVHCKDNSLGIHDHPLTKKLQPATAFGPPPSAVNDSTRRYTPASTFGSGPRVRGASHALLSTYKPLFHMTRGANTSGSTYRLPHSLSVSAPDASFLRAGASLSQKPPTLAGLGRTPSAHRAAPMTLTFPQFVDALRFVAEEVVGHPQTTPLVELTLLRIVNDLLKVRPSVR